MKKTAVSKMKMKTIWDIKRLIAIVEKREGNQINQIKPITYFHQLKKGKKN